MSDAVSWLPDLVLFEDYGGDWNQYLEAVYRLFRADFVDAKPTWPERRWAVKRRPEHDGKEATFWHIVSKGDDESSRPLDLRRCERIRWPRQIIDAFGGQQVKLWRNRRDGNDRVLIATTDFSYVVVLEDRAEFIMLWTAYPVERDHQRMKLRREYEAYKKG